MEFQHFVISTFCYCVTTSIRRERGRLQNLRITPLEESSVLLLSIHQALRSWLSPAKPHRQQCLSPRQRWRSSTSSTSTLIFPSHHPLHVSHITAMPEKNVCRYLNKVDSRWRACVTITRYTCILDVTLDPPKRVDYYPNYEIHFY